MALSMLTACGSSDTDTTVAAAAVASTATTNTAIVEATIEQLEAINKTAGYAIGLNTELTGNESVDLKVAVEAVKNISEAPTYTGDAWLVTLADITGWNGFQNASTAYVLIVKNDGTVKASDIGTALADQMAMQASEGVKYMSAFNASLVIDSTTGSIGTSSVGSAKDYWVIVITTDKA